MDAQEAAAWVASSGALGALAGNDQLQVRRRCSREGRESVNSYRDNTLVTSEVGTMSSVVSKEDV